jgi:AcrR family transcriptional regulator
VGGRVVSRETILACAIEIGDSRGIEDLTLRLLAEELGIGTMTIYSYFQGKDQILDAMADELLGKLEVPVDAGADLSAVIRAIARAYRALFARHPSALRLLATRGSSGEQEEGNAVGGLDTSLAALRQAGLPIGQAVQVMGVVVHYVLGFSLYQRARPWGWPDADAELLRIRSRRYEAFNANAFPHVVEAAEDLAKLPTDEQLEIGLDALCLGLEALVASRSAP